MGAKNYSDLIAWQKAVDLVCQIYQATRDYPADERFGLTSQMRRAAVSIPANIAEGQGRASVNEFVHFLSIAHGSLRELETHIIISHRLAFLSAEEKTNPLAATVEIGKLISGLARSLRESS